MTFTTGPMNGFKVPQVSFSSVGVTAESYLRDILIVPLNTPSEI